MFGEGKCNARSALGAKFGHVAGVHVPTLVGLRK